MPKALSRSRTAPEMDRTSSPAPPGLSLRPATPGDLPACARIYLEARRGAFLWQDAADFRLDDFAAATEGEQIWIAADRNGTVLGFASVWLEPGLTYLHNLFVAPGRQGAGIGSALLRQALRIYPHPVELKTDDGNEAARRFYRARGFAVVELSTGTAPGRGWQRLRHD